MLLPFQLQINSLVVKNAALKINEGQGICRISLDPLILGGVLGRD